MAEPGAGGSRSALEQLTSERSEFVLSSKSILVFMGTRPEAIKLAPVVAALRKTDDLACTVVATGQHKEMFQQVIDRFGVTVDAELDVMRPNQSLAELTARLMTSIDAWLASAHPDMYSNNLFGAQ